LAQTKFLKLFSFEQPGTSKHKKSMFVNEKPAKTCSKFVCNNCNKTYKDNSGLWRHTKKCLVKENKSEDKDKQLEVITELFQEQMKENKELKELLVEQNKKLLDIAEKGQTTNITNNNNNNFNLHIFLNEQCKDALNIMDFVNQIKLQLSDLDMLGRLGYTEGMSKIIIRNLKELDVCKRPIHCSDLKRETLYVKDNDAWEKENGENNKIKRVIKHIECKNIKQIPQWVEENPTSEDTDTKKHMEYKNIVLQAMGGSTLEDDNKKHEKIIRNIAKEVVISKNKK
jgi:hypothetical protein